MSIPQSLAILAGSALALAACADPTTSPRALDEAPSMEVVDELPAAPAGALFHNLNSGSSYTYCGFNATIDPMAGTVFAPDGGSTTDLTAALLAYNPGWPAPLGTSSWMGASAEANEYTMLPGSYCFERTFDVGTSSDQVLNMTIKADNVAVVYLNGDEIGRHTPTADDPDNWQTNLLVTSDNIQDGLNTLRVVLINTRIGYPGNNCAQGPQADSDYAFPNGQTWSITECRNPSAVDFTATAYYVPSNNLWCSPGFWKNAKDAAWTYAGVSKNESYNDINGTNPDFNDDPTIYEVISKPQVYGGPAANIAATYISGEAGFNGTQTSNSGCGLNNHGRPITADN